MFLSKGTGHSIYPLLLKCLFLALWSKGFTILLKFISCTTVTFPSSSIPSLLAFPYFHYCISSSNSFHTQVWYVWCLIVLTFGTERGCLIGRPHHKLKRDSYEASHVAITWNEASDTWFILSCKLFKRIILLINKHCLIKPCFIILRNLIGLRH